MLRTMGNLAQIRNTVASFLALGVTALSAGLALSSCDDPPTVAEYLAKSKISGKTTIRIGVNGDQPLMGVWDAQRQQYTGFDIEIAKYLARSLGFGESNISWQRVEVEDRERMLENNQVDLIVASYSITESRAKRVNFAGPYLITSQEVLVPASRAGELTNMPKLLGVRVCTTGGSTSEQNLKAAGFRPSVELSDRLCIDGIRRGDYDALSTDLTILTGFKHEFPGKFEIVDVPIGESERLGVGVAKTDPYLRDVITYFLATSYRKGEDGAWRAAFDKTLGTEMPEWANISGQPEPVIHNDLRDHADAS